MKHHQLFLALTIVGLLLLVGFALAALNPDCTELAKLVWSGL